MKVRNYGGIIWKICFVICTIFSALILIPFVFIIMGISSGVKYVAMELVFFFDLIFDTNYHYNFFKEV